MAAPEGTQSDAPLEGAGAAHARKRHIEPIRQTVTVRGAPQRAFYLFTEQMGTWWPVAEYSRAVSEFEDDVQVERLEFQAGTGGSILEHMSDGRILPWAEVIAWHPPHGVVMAWHPHSKPEPPTEVKVTFTTRGSDTLVELETGDGGGYRRTSGRGSMRSTPAGGSQRSGASPRSPTETFRRPHSVRDVMQSSGSEMDDP